MNNTLVDLFNLGMMRSYSDIIKDIDHENNIVLNIGAGEKQIKNSIPLDYPEYDFEKDPIPYADNSVGQIHCYHFLEHIDNVSHMMMEFYRVLQPGGHINIVVPYYNSQMQYSDIDHKSFFSERTFKHMFNLKYYRKNKIPSMEIKTNFIIGDNESNLCLIVQLIKN